MPFRGQNLNRKVFQHRGSLHSLSASPCHGYHSKPKAVSKTDKPLVKLPCYNLSSKMGICWVLVLVLSLTRWVRLSKSLYLTIPPFPHMQNKFTTSLTCKRVPRMNTSLLPHVESHAIGYEKGGWHHKYQVFENGRC